MQKLNFVATKLTIIVLLLSPDKTDVLQLKSFPFIQSSVFHLCLHRLRNATNGSQFVQCMTFLDMIASLEMLFLQVPNLLTYSHTHFQFSSSRPNTHSRSPIDSFQALAVHSQILIWKIVDNLKGTTFLKHYTISQRPNREITKSSFLRLSQS